MGDECRYFSGIEFAGIHVQAHSVRGEEVVAGIPVQLGSLAAGGGVFHGQSVQSELVRHHLKIADLGHTQIHPHQRRAIAQMF